MSEEGDVIDLKEVRAALAAATSGWWSEPDERDLYCGHRVIWSPGMGDHGLRVGIVDKPEDAALIAAAPAWLAELVDRLERAEVENAELRETSALIVSRDMALDRAADAEQQLLAAEVEVERLRAALRRERDYMLGQADGCCSLALAVGCLACAWLRHRARGLDAALAAGKEGPT
jgi:hypothetical protein